MSIAAAPASGEPGTVRERSSQSLAAPAWSWPGDLLTLNERFGCGHPFPHLVLDDVFDPSQLMLLHSEVPDPGSDFWTLWGSGGEEYCGPLNRKRGISTLLLLGEATGRFLRRLNSEAFVEDLREISGEPELCVDHTFNGGWLHCTGRGGRLHVHADKVRHPRPTLFDQAINLILFLQPYWRKDWGGELEFWSRDAHEKCTSVSPRFNRLVLFRSDRESFHGHPEPVACPEGVYRTSLAVYYYRPRPEKLPTELPNEIDWRS